MKKFLINPIWVAVLVLAALIAGCGEENGVVAGSSASGASFWMPALAPIGNKSVSEGELLNFTVYSSDASGSTLIFFASGLSAGASFNPTTKTFTWTPTYAQNGTYTVKFSVMNSWNLIAEETITITVADVNVTPAIAAIATKTASEGSLLNFTVPGSDAGNDALTYEITGLPSGATFISSTGVFNWTPDYTQSGSYPGITVRATDPGALYDEETFDIIVSNTNRAPTLSGIGNKAIAEMSLLTFTISGSDPDGDAITYTATNLPTGATFDSGARTFSWTPDYSQSGNYTTVKFRVTDTDGLYAEETITIVVNNVNRTPTLTAIGNKSTNENAILSFTITGSDPDAETLSYSATGLPSGASLNSSSGAFSWTPSYTQSGSYSVTFRTSDIGGLYAEEPISITVTNVNRTPTFSPVIGNKTTSEASLLSFSITGTDPDSDAITYTAGNLPVGAVMTASSGAFTWTPTYDQSGVYPNVAFTVTDTAGLYTTEAITITVNNTNRAPVLSPVGNQSTNENQLLTFTILGTDPDGGSVTYTGISLPSGATVVSSTGVFSWTPTYLQAGTYSTVRFRATDIGGLYGEELITIVVTNVNVAPVLASIGNKTVNEGTVLAFTVTASDVGGDTMTYSAITLPSGATLNSSNGIFRWTPTYDQAGVYASINFKATDPGALYDEEAITITVNNTNRAPNLNPTGSQNINENSLLTFTVSGSDPDGDSITFTATGLPSGATFDSPSQTFTWTPTYLQAGSYNVVVRVTDTLGATSQESVNILVNNLNRPCTLNPIGAKNVDEGILLSFTISGTDPDTDDTLSYYAYNMPTGAQLNVDSGLFTWTPTFVQAGVYNVTFRVLDPYGSYDDELVAITVNDVPAPPTVTTEPASDIDVNMVTLNGTANPNEISSTAYFQWGISTTYGATTTAQALGSGATILNVSQVITGLEHNSTYYYRMVAYNSVGTSYGITRTFTTITNSNWAMVAGGEFHTIGVKNDGSLWAWGDNSQGQLGLNDLISRTAPTRVGTENTWVEAACGSGFTVARKNTHTIWGSGDNSEGQLGLGGAITRTLVFLQVGTGTDWTRISAGGSSHCVAVKQNSTIWTWGTNNKGQLGLGDYTNRIVPEVVSGGTWKAAACGYDHTMAISSDGSLYTWGDNSSAQLGTGDYVTKTTPTLITTTPFSDVAGGYGHTVAIKSNGDLFAWGDNSEGELGTGDLVTRTTPTLITTSGWSDIEVGYKHTVAKKTDGSIWSWGDNSDGQLGLGDLVTRTNPTLITGTGLITWTDVAAGWKFTIGLTSNDELLEWGDNQFGQLGLGDTTDVTFPSAEDDPLANSSWPAYGRDLKHTHLSPYVGPSTDTLRWRYNTGVINFSSPAIAMDGTIYIGSTDDKLYALNPNGTLKWTYTTGGDINSSPAIAASGVIYVSSDDGNCYAINPNGTLKWIYTIGGSPNSFPRSSPSIASDGTIYVGGAALYALNSNGGLKWSYTPPTSGFMNSSPAIATDGTIYVGCSYSRLYAINSNGTLKWSFDAGTQILNAPAIGTDGAIYFSAQQALYALNPNGTLRWTSTPPGAQWSFAASPAIAADGTIYQYGTNYLYAHNPNGTLRWTCNIGSYGYYKNSAPAIGADGTIYVGGGLNDNRIYAINPDSSVRWAYSVGGAGWTNYSDSSPAIGADGTLYIGCRDGYFYAFGQ